MIKLYLKKKRVTGHVLLASESLHVVASVLSCLKAPLHVKGRRVVLDLCAFILS